jgi:hypothetical protein
MDDGHGRAAAPSGPGPADRASGTSNGESRKTAIAEREARPGLPTTAEG